jgi:adenylosuccinate synthase
MLNRFTGIAVTKLDVLDGMPSLRICTAYRLGQERYVTVPRTAVLQRVEPEYEELPGWSQPTSHAKTWDDLPLAARDYLRRIEALAGAPVTIVSVGRGRDETILLSNTDRQ